MGKKKRVRVRDEDGLITHVICEVDKIVEYNILGKKVIKERLPLTVGRAYEVQRTWWDAGWESVDMFTIINDKGKHEMYPVEYFRNPDKNRKYYYSV